MVWAMLSGLELLTRLEFSGEWHEPGILAGKTRLQHFEGVGNVIGGGPAGVEGLLSHLAQLQQLTHLRWSFSAPDLPAPAAYSALTASSKLQHLDVRVSWLPADAWQHIFPAGRELPNLQVLDVGYTYHPGPGWHRAPVPAAAPEVSRLVSCCPGLQSLRAAGLRHNRALLAPLAGLSGLTQLELFPEEETVEGLEVVCQLTGLRDLELLLRHGPEGLLLQLSGLRQLTRLDYWGRLNGKQERLKMEHKVGIRL